MADYQDLENRVNAGDVLVLDGAIGTELQAMGAPMNEQSWAGLPNLTHPNTVLQMHINYIKAGADVITTNTYSSARHNLEPLGHGELTTELNLRAVHIAQEAIFRANAGRPIYIAGAVSNFGLLAGGEYNRLRRARAGHMGRPGMRRGGFLRRGVITEQQSKDNLKEQSDILAEAGVDFMLAESTGSLEQRKWVSEAVASVGLPMWTGFKVHSTEDDPTIRIGYAGEEPFEQALEEVLPMGGSLMTVFHSGVDDTDAAIPILKKFWSGPMAAYPESGRRDYVARFSDGTPNEMDAEGYLGMANKWVNEGVQVIGGCCGMGLDYIKPLRAGLPAKLAEPRVA